MPAAALAGSGVENVREITGRGLGAVAGALAGSAIGPHLDDAAQAEANRATVRALDTSPAAGDRITWEALATTISPARGAVTVTRQGTNAAGAVCREYRQSVTIGDATEEIVGTARRDASGIRRIVEG